MRRRRWKKFSTLTTLMISGALLRLLFVFVIPTNPDHSAFSCYPPERQHLEIIRQIDQHGGLPVYPQGETDEATAIREVAQSPLYYYFVLISYNIFEFIHKGLGIYGTRLLSVIFGIVCAWVAYNAAMMLSGKKKDIAIGTLIAFLFAPNSMIISSTTTNDSLLMLVSAVFFLNLIYCRTHNGGIIRQMFTGVTLGIMTWVNLSAVFLIPVVWFAADPMNESKERWLARGRTFSSMLLVVLPLVLWMFAGSDYFVSLRSIFLQDYTTISRVFESDRNVLEMFLSLVNGFFSTVVHLLTMRHTNFFEVFVCAIWFIFWLIISGIGANVANSDIRSRGVLISGIIFVALGFLALSISMYDVNFALFSLVFFPLSYFAALGSDRVYLSVWQQVFAWIMPIIFMPLFR